MSQNYTPEFKKKSVRLHEEQEQIHKSITVEYGVLKGESFLKKRGILCEGNT